MKKNFNDLGRRVRSQEEIDARREARRKLYEEMDAFEQDLPDFIFAEDQTDTTEEYYDIEDTENLPEEEAAEEVEESWTEEPEESWTGEFIELQEEPADTAQELPVEETPEENKEVTAEEPKQEKKEVRKTSKKTTGAKKKKSASGKKTSSKKTSGKKRRRRRRNVVPFVLAASIAAVVLGGGFFGMQALGVIGGKELYEVYVNDKLVGKVATEEEGRDTYLQVRREVVSRSDEMVLMEADCDVRKIETIVKVPSKPEVFQEKMKKALEDNIVGTLDKAYTVKINDYIVNLKEKTEVVDLLEAVKSPYDQDNQYAVQLVADTTKELTGLTTQMVRTEESSDIAGVASEEQEEVPAAEMQEEEQEEAPAEEQLPEATGENDGLKEVSFVEKIEIAESYVTAESITPLDQALSDITKEQEENKIYEVTSGDCLSVVADKNHMTVSKLLELNDSLEEDTVLQIGDEIVVTTPEPELSVATQEEVSYEEDYEEEVQYIDNDSWYTTKEEVRQEAATGHRRVTARITYKNGNETGREIVAQSVVTPAVPKIIERGTQAPPSYIKPLSGGRLSSGFGKRWGRMHKGIDWACPVGTAIKASCGGTVVSAGWSSGYGYCVTLRHPDGRQTRYAHLSKLLVSPGKKVKQGDKIALSGNTGRSTGPHLHFEIIINGSQVNPAKYLH